MLMTQKEQRFVDAYLGSAAGNGTAAARAAGYKGNARTLAVQANRMLRKADIRQAISEREAKRAAEGIADADERDKKLSTIMRKTKDEQVAIQAIKELNKCTGRHSLALIHKGKLTLEQALERSLEDAPPTQEG